MREPLAPLLLLAALLPLGACRGPDRAPLPGDAAVNAVPSYAVYDGDDLILTIRGEPGPITSTAPPPPGGAVTTHPFLSAAAQDAGYEAQLKALLDASASLEDYLARLREAGFRVEER